MAGTWGGGRLATLQTTVKICIVHLTFMGHMTLPDLIKSEYLTDHFACVFSSGGDCRWSTVLNLPGWSGQRLTDQTLTAADGFS